MSSTTVPDDSESSVLDPENSQGGDEYKTSKSPLKDYVELISSIQGQHEKLINNSDDMLSVSMTFNTAMLLLALTPTYELHNLNNDDGRFEGTGWTSGYPEFIEKDGLLITFGMDGVRKEKGWSPNDLEGDRILSDGSFDGDAGYMRYQTSVEREDELASKNTAQSFLVDNETVHILYQFGQSIDLSGFDNIKTTHLYMSVGSDHFDFVVAQSDDGAAYEEISSDFDSIEDAIEHFESLAYNVTYSGSIVDGAFKLTTH